MEIPSGSTPGPNLCTKDFCCSKISSAGSNIGAHLTEIASKWITRQHFTPSDFYLTVKLLLTRFLHFLLFTWMAHRITKRREWHTPYNTVGTVNKTESHIPLMTNRCAYTQVDGTRNMCCPRLRLLYSSEIYQSSTVKSATINKTKPRKSRKQKDVANLKI